METKIYIYVLDDPSGVSSTVYVGYTIDPGKRIKRHLEEATCDRPERRRYRNCWIRSLLKRDVLPRMTVVEEVLDGNWQEAEKHHIAYYKSIGIHLCNDTDGGDGTLGMKHRQETIEKMSKAKLGIPMKEEDKLKRMRQDVLQDIGCIEEMYKAGYSLTEIGTIYDANDETIKYHLEKASVELRTEKYTDRYKAKITEAATGKTQSPETKEKRSNSLKGRTRPEEVCAKISTTRKAKIASGEIKMPTNRATGENARTYRSDVDTNLLIALFNKGLSFRAIGKEVGLEHHSVKARLKKAGVVQ